MDRIKRLLAVERVEKERRDKDLDVRPAPSPPVCIRAHGRDMRGSDAQRAGELCSCRGYVESQSNRPAPVLN